MSEVNPVKTASARFEIWLVAALITIHLALALTSMRQLSLTWDEPSYIGAGYYYLKTGNQQLIPLQLHPPLSYYLNSILLLPLNLDTVKVTESGFYSSRLLLFESGYSPKLLLFLSRLPFVFVSVLLSLLVWRWGRKLYGISGGLLACFFYAFTPMVLANARLTTPDIVLALTTTAALFSFHKYLQQPSPKQLYLSGITLGFALLSKFTALLLIPTLLIVAMASHVIRDDEMRQTKSHLLGQILLLFCIASLVVWAGYGFQVVLPFVPDWLPPETRQLIAEKPFWQAVAFFRENGIPVPAYSFILGIYTQLAAAKGWQNNFLFGHISKNGWWYYYWLAFLIKNPIPFLMCIAVGLVSMWRRKKEEGEWLLLYSIVPFVIFFSLPSKINIGVRYLLPLIPLLCIIAGKAALVFTFKLDEAPAIGWPRHKVLRIAAPSMLAALCLWQTGAVAWIHPYYLAYFNEMVGGPSQGYNFLADSNLDWGQELDRLSEYLKKNNIDDAKIRYFGPPGVLKYYGLENVEETNLEPSPGVWAVSATSLQGLYMDDPERYKWLRKLHPTKVIGYSIFVYDVQQQDLQNTK